MERALEVDGLVGVVADLCCAGPGAADGNVRPDGELRIGNITAYLGFSQNDGSTAADRLGACVRKSGPRDGERPPAGNVEPAGKAAAAAECQVGVEQHVAQQIEVVTGDGKSRSGCERVAVADNGGRSAAFDTEVGESDRAEVGRGLVKGESAFVAHHEGSAGLRYAAQLTGFDTGAKLKLATRQKDALAWICRVLPGAPTVGPKGYEARRDVHPPRVVPATEPPDLVWHVGVERALEVNRFIGQ